MSREHHNNHNKPDIAYKPPSTDVFASVHDFFRRCIIFANSGDGVEPMSLADLTKRLGLSEKP